MSDRLEALELAVQAGAGATNAVVADDCGRPSIMVRIPAFRISEVIPGASDALHPAFIVNGVEVPEIYISKYQATVIDGRAYSLPDEVPVVDVSFDDAVQLCESKGPGWHLMTAAEWAAIALWCRRNGVMPRGNNDFGKDYRENVRSALPATWEAEGGEKQVGRGEGRVAAVRTGTGPVSWSHNGQTDGIWDLNGNVAEWLGGCRLLDGEIQVTPGNDAAAQIDLSASSPRWRAIDVEGELVDPGSDGTLKLDFRDDRITVSTEVQEHTSVTRGATFETAVADDGLEIPEILRALALFPADDGDHQLNYAYTKTRGERMCMRGSHWNRQSRCGVFALYMCPQRSDTAFMMGFRAAYVPVAGA
ncbi:MAG: SUMF1/EgtB/PvdO family nonheme iron enzyme [Protaetiibacter sp.]